MNLLVLAAGMGSRFGGLKQLEPVGLSNEFILDYSIKDAIDVGFKKVIFVIRKENLDDFKETIGKRLENKIKVEYAFQEIAEIPLEVNVKRTKPWGTVQAILSAEKYIDNNFALINADDFYGKETFRLAYKELINLNTPNKFSSVLYEAKETLSENGKVKRGVCMVGDNRVSEIIEAKVWEDKGFLICEPLNGSEKFTTSLDSLVSMNMFLFNKSIFKILKENFKKFLECKENLEDKECLITDVINDELHKGNIELNYVKTKAKWIGMTYKEDLPFVKNAIKKLIDSKEYNESLWS